ncbi:unnamed protein product [Oreochromis niloticus]|nr:unnamed protein product [Mustela putorius furo]
MQPRKGQSKKRQVVVLHPLVTSRQRSWPYRVECHQTVVEDIPGGSSSLDEQPGCSSSSTFITGVSVCLRYMTDTVQPNFPLFTLSPGISPLSLQGSFDTFMLSYYDSFSVNLQPIVHLWPDIKQDIWTSVCLTVDTSKSVVQMFSGGYMSPRKVMPYQYVWSGEPVISFPGFDGQLTDVQVWDYPLRYRDIIYYMSRSYYGSYSGSVISWSNIRYNNRGRAVLEDTFDMRAKVEQESRRKEKKMRFFRVEEENKLLL